MVMSILYVCFIMNSRRSADHVKLAVWIPVRLIRELSVLILRLLEIGFLFVCSVFICQILERYAEPCVVVCKDWNCFFFLSFEYSVSNSTLPFGRSLFLTTIVTMKGSLWATVSPVFCSHCFIHTHFELPRRRTSCILFLFILIVSVSSERSVA